MGLIRADDAALSGVTALVPGGGGFIGARVCARLASAGADVHALGRSACAPVGLSAQWQRVDVGDRRAVRAAVARIKPDVVFHLAGGVSGAPNRELMVPMARDHVLGTINLLDAAADAGVPRVVLIGSMVEPSLEGGQRVAASPYAAAKAAATLIGELYRTIYSVEVVNLRLFMVYGEGQDESKVLPYIVTSLLRAQRPRLTSAALPLDWVHVDDVAGALLAAARAELPNGRLDIGSGRLVTVAELAHRVARLLGSALEPELGAVADRPIIERCQADVSRTAAAIGWRPEISLDQGLRRTVDWYERHMRRSL